MPKLISRFNPKGNWWVKFLDAWLKGDVIMIEDEITRMKNGELESVCRCGGKSYAKAGAVVDMLLNDAGYTIQGVRKAAPRLLVNQLKRENERLKSIFDGKGRQTSSEPGD